MAKRKDTDKPDLQLIEGGKTSDKLTAKQSAFVHAILDGASQSDAYRQAYNAEGMADNSIWREASVLFSNPKVATRIKALQARQDEAALLSGLATRQHIQRTLFGLTTKGENDAAKIRACELLGKMTDVAAFTMRVEQVGHDADPEAIQAELEERLKKAFGG